ncbi:MAG: alpha/beta hydrolase [Oscillospiraceae bacterium]|jgi:pimeloyl-ACP methyl ester carboxylesterase|nr:alpha/beta hydrolase [Oscillospiraceae bacterium]
MEININGVNLYYEKVGSGKPLILLHGNGESGKIFDKAIPVLSEHYTVYCLDTRGHGKSSKVSEYHYEDMARDLLGFIHELNLDRPIVYGFSDGGITALLAASYEPESVSRLIVSGANTDPRGVKPFWYYAGQVIYTLSFKRNSLMKLMLTEPNITAEQLGKIEAPVTVIVGSRDLIRESHTRELAEHIKHSTLKILPGEGHSSYIIHSPKIAHLIIDTLKAPAPQPHP